MGILPSILEKDWSEIEKKLEICQGFARSVHIDFIDGKFAENSTFLDPQPFSDYAEYFQLEAHLMVINPIDYLDSLFAAGFKTVIAQVEHMQDQIAFVAKAQQLGGVGLAIDLDSPLSAIRVAKEDLDQILLLSVKAGHSHQAFDPRVIDKLKTLKNEYLGNIAIDGGISAGNIESLFEAGARSFAANSYIFANEDPESRFRELEQKIDF